MTEYQDVKTGTTLRATWLAPTFRQGVALADSGDRTVVTGPIDAFAVRSVSPGVADALAHMLREPFDRDAAELGAEDINRLDRVLARSFRLVAHVQGGGSPDPESTHFVRWESTSEENEPLRPHETDPATEVRLSRFTLLRTHGDELVVESPRSSHRAVLLDPAAAAVVTALATPTSTSRIGTDLDADVVADIVGLMISTGLAESRSDDGVFASSSHPVLRKWAFHDLVFHSRSRSGRFDQPFGGVFPYVGELEPEPAVKPIPDGPRIALPRPSRDDVRKHDADLTTVLEGRTSIRSYGDTPITVDQLGEFLYRTARVRSTFGPDESILYPASSRPYPCGGAAYELELYVTVARCDGLDDGIYYYAPGEHALVAVNDDLDVRDRIVHSASVATGNIAHPDLVLTMTARFERVSWKYQAIAYAVTLKHAGVLYQTMYLVATAMGLAPCGLGSGNADLAAEAFGLDYEAESSVGEFILGSRPDTVFPNAISSTWNAGLDPEWGVLAKRELGLLS